MLANTFIQNLKSANTKQLVLYLLLNYLLMVIIIPSLTLVMGGLVGEALRSVTSKAGYAIGIYFVIEYVFLFISIYITDILKNRAKNTLNYLLVFKIIIFVLLIPFYWIICGLYLGLVSIGFGCIIQRMCILN